MEDKHLVTVFSPIDETQVVFFPPTRYIKMHGHRGQCVLKLEQLSLGFRCLLIFFSYTLTYSKQLLSTIHYLTVVVNRNNVDAPFPISCHMTISYHTIDHMTNIFHKFIKIEILLLTLTNINVQRVFLVVLGSKLN